MLDKRSVDREQNSYARKDDHYGPIMMNEVTQLNNTFYYSTKTEECLERLKNNQSDLSTSMISYYQYLDGFTVPVQLMPGDIQFITGYKLNFTAIKPRECATVMANIQLLGPFVHLTSLALIFSLILIISTGIIMKFKLKRKYSCELTTRKMSKSKTVKKVMKQIIKELSLVYNRKSIRFRWISFLFTILCFYLVLSSRSLYKTSQVIVNEPYVVKDYEMLLNDKQSLPIFYDTFSITSELFKFAPENSLKKKIWSKLIKSKVQMKNHIINGEVLINLDFFKNIFKKIDEKHFAFFANSFAAEFIEAMFCCLSPEDELWRLFRLTDESEIENLIGYPFSEHFNDLKSLSRSMRRYFESHLSVIFYRKLIASSKKFASTLSPADRPHQYEQSLICSDDFKLDTKLDVKAIGMGYYKSFFITLVVITISSYFINTYERLYFKYQHKTVMS